MEQFKMEQSHVEVTPQTQEPTATEQTSTEIKDGAAVLAKNKELLEKNAKYKNELNELKEFKKSIETKELEAKGEFDKIIANLTDELNKTKEELTTTRQTHEYDKFKNKVKSVAKKANCVDADLLFNLMTEDQQKAMLENGEFDAEKAKNVMEEIRKSYSHIRLFDDKKINHTPSVVTPVKPNPQAANKAASIAELLVKKK